MRSPSARRAPGSIAYFLAVAALACLIGGTPSTVAAGDAPREAASKPAAPGDAWTLFNPTGRAYDGERVRLRLALPPDFAADRYAVLEGGVEVPYQAESIDGTTRLWVQTDMGANQTRAYRLERRAPRRFPGKVKLARDGDVFVLENGAIGVRVPAAAGAEPPPPILQVRLPDGRWIGRGTRQAPCKMKKFDAAVIGEGPLFAKVRLQFDFEGTAGLDNVPAFHRVDVSLAADRRHAVIEEAHAMPRGSFWELDVAHGWSPRDAAVVPHFGGFDRPALMDPDGKPYPWPPNTLRAGQTRMGDTLLNLIPRWSQAYDDGWWFTAADGTHAAGAAACRAGRWLWPHDNLISVKVKASADFAGLRCPTWRGRRYWYLLAGPAAPWADKASREDYILRHAFESLDKLHGEYLLEWPGAMTIVPAGKPSAPAGDDPAGKFGRRSKPFFGWGPGSGHLAAPDHPIRHLAIAQAIIDPDTFGNYWLFFSPENPNFATAWWQDCYWKASNTAGHPRFADIAKLAEMKFREDLYHSVTIPGGAGQECPGYLSHSMGLWRKIAPVCKEKLGFDPTQWPQWRAAGSYLLHLSQPMGDGSRRCLPAGDTHPPGPDPVETARLHGVEEDAAAFRTEELPGFGVVFRNRPATPRETYLSFKSGPNRGHFHGDQLSFHYCPFARPQIVDHHCSYGPRAGQEHMHNRVAFHTPTLPYANMDGYERVIAFVTSAEADAAIGQVESERLRYAQEFPPEKWDTRLPQEVLDVPLRYRRTVVLVKGGALDYVVLRDQHDGPDVSATYCLHVYGETLDRKENAFEFDALTVFVAAPRDFAVDRHDWRHTNGGLEKTLGLRLTVKGRSSEFITVLLPKVLPAAEQARLVLAEALVRPDGKKADLLVGLANKDGRLSDASAGFTAPDYNKGQHQGAAQLEEAPDGLKLRLDVTVGGDRWVKGGKGEYAVQLKRSGDSFSGSYSGTFGGKAVAGALSGGIVKDGYPLALAYQPSTIPMAAIPGGVRVGGDEIVFAGGVDGDVATAYVTVKRGGRTILAVTGKEIDLDRSQGDVGLFVPDAGYPFGVIPDWLIRQRGKRPDWYVEMWPLTERTATNRK
jgi:hypothetical protein